MILKNIINILGQDITIKFRKNLRIEEKDEHTNKTKITKCDGVYLPDSNSIYIEYAIKNNRSKLEDTFFHELLECILTLLEIDLNHPVITQISTVLYGSFKSGKFLKKINFKLIPIEDDIGVL